LHSISINTNQDKPRHEFNDIESSNCNIHTSHDTQAKQEIEKQEQAQIKKQKAKNNPNFIIQFHNNHNNPRSKKLKTTNYTREGQKKREKLTGMETQRNRSSFF
jgi:hypothetical protein